MVGRHGRTYRREPDGGKQARPGAREARCERTAGRGLGRPAVGEEQVSAAHAHRDPHWCSRRHERPAALEERNLPATARRVEPEQAVHANPKRRSACRTASTRDECSARHEGAYLPPQRSQAWCWSQAVAAVRARLAFPRSAAGAPRRRRARRAPARWPPHSRAAPGGRSSNGRTACANTAIPIRPIRR